MIAAGMTAGAAALAPAPLCEHPDNPTPAGAAAFWLDGTAGKRFRILLAPADGEARASVIISPGRIEGFEKYFETVRDLQRRGYATLSVDWRGQGLAERLGRAPERGHIDRVDYCVDDLERALQAVGPRLPGPLLLLCHSMGGMIGLHVLLSGRIAIGGAAFSAPMWGFKNLPPGAAALAAGVTALGLGQTLAPGQARLWSPTPYEGNIFTTDPDRFARNEAILTAFPQLRLGGPSFAWVHHFMRAQRAAHRPGAIEALDLPAFIAIAGQDALIDNRAIAAIAARWRGAETVTFPEARHEILQERAQWRDAFWAGFERMARRALSAAA